jgi:hypothetical protein
MAPNAMTRAVTSRVLVDDLPQTRQRPPAVLNAASSSVFDDRRQHLRRVEQGSIECSIDGEAAECDVGCPAG